MCRGGIALAHQVLRTGNEVEPGIGFVAHASCIVPFLPILAATADMGNGIDATALKPCQAQGRKILVHGNAIAAVAVDNGGVTTIEH